MAKQGFMNSNNLGIMQGRLVNSPNKKIQCFPAKEWKKEFRLANRNNFRLIEWTVNKDNLYSNPLLHRNKLQEIQKQKKLFLGNLYARRDWGHAKDYCLAMWKFLYLYVIIVDIYFNLNWICRFKYNDSRSWISNCNLFLLSKWNIITIWIFYNRSSAFFNIYT